MKPTRWLENVNCAIEGILWAVKSQRHMRAHCVAALVVLVLALFFKVTALEFLFLSAAVILVFFAELVNTALEVVVDLISPEIHPLAKRAKDVAAGAVLVAAVGAVVVGYLVFSGALELQVGDLVEAHPLPGRVAMVSVLIVTILVILLKSRFGKGAYLYGGMPSGHSAVAFSIAMSVALSGAGVIVSLLCFVVAAMVSHSRLLLRVHSVREVGAGALLGMLVTLLVSLCFG